MKPLFRVVLVMASVVSNAELALAGQSSAKPAAAGIPECDKYEAMVAACLPKMCEAERIVAELDLELHRQILPAVIQHKGRAAAVQACVEKTNEAVAEDAFGCYATKGGVTRRPASAVRVDKVQPTNTGVVMTLSGDGAAAGAVTEVILVTAPGEPPAAVYRLPEWKGQFVLDTSTLPAKAAKGTAPGPVRLDPRTTYCFIVESTRDAATEVHRKGMFTTLPQR
jgi:hypothetical protein